MVRSRRLPTKKILIASVGVAVAAYVSTVGCNRYPVGNLMPPDRDRSRDANADAAREASQDGGSPTDAASAANATTDAEARAPVDFPDDPRVTSGNLMAPTPTPPKKRDAGR